MRLHTRAEAQDLPGADLHTSDDRQPAILGPKHDANLVRRDARSSQARQQFPPALELQSANLDVGQLRMKGTASKKGVQAVASSDGSLVWSGSAKLRLWSVRPLDRLLIMLLPVTKARQMCLCLHNSCLMRVTSSWIASAMRSTRSLAAITEVAVQLTAPDPTMTPVLSRDKRNVRDQ